MERNIIKMIDLTQYMLMESTGDSETKSDLDTGSFSRQHRGFFQEFDNNNDDNDNDDGDNDDAESCSYGSSNGGYADGFCHRDKKNVLHDNDNDDDDDDGTSYDADDDDDDNDDDDGTSYDADADDDDDVVDSKMVEVSKKCGAFGKGRMEEEERDCSNSNAKFLNIDQKENDKNFWETCLAS